MALVDLKVTHHLVFSSLPDPADVIIVLLSDVISHVGTYVLQDSSSNIVCYSEILGVARCAHPAKWAEAQRENVPVAIRQKERNHTPFIASRKDDHSLLFLDLYLQQFYYRINASLE